MSDMIKYDSLRLGASVGARLAERMAAFEASTAREAAESRRQMEAVARAAQERHELERKAALATIELNELTKKQNQMLRAQIEKLTEGKMAAAKYEYDVFVSHANANKQSFVDSLYDQLNRLRIRIWYDSTEIDWGDGLKEKIQEGLAKCRFGIVILSPEFIDRKWTNQELTELLTRQNESHEKVVLPLLYNLTVDQMKEQYPILGNIKAREVRSGEDAKDVVIDFARVLIRALK